MDVKFRNNRGVNLVELLVVLALAVLVFGVLTTLYIQMDRGSTRSLQSEKAWGEARLILNSIAQYLRQATDAGNIQVAGLNQSFEPDRITVAVTDDGKVSELRIYSEAGAIRDTLYFDRIYFDGETSNIEKQPLGKSLNDFSYALGFQYADSFDGIEPQWQNSYEGEGLPKLIRVNIGIDDLDDTIEPLNLHIDLNFLQ